MTHKAKLVCPVCGASCIVFSTVLRCNECGTQFKSLDDLMEQAAAKNPYVQVSKKELQSYKISYILSTFNRSNYLACMLYSLLVQTHTNFEVIIMDNTALGCKDQKRNEALIARIGGSLTYLNRERDYPAIASDCYTAAEVGVERANGDFVCFPSDDGYYSPRFGMTMLDALLGNSWDLTYCDCIFDRERWGKPNDILSAAPVVNQIDKTNFLLRRNQFIPFPQKKPGFPALCDGYIIETLVKNGIAHGKVRDILVWHN